jgi:DNA-directed RNA polymerase subunit L
LKHSFEYEFITKGRFGANLVSASDRIHNNASLSFVVENENYTIVNIIQNYLAEPTLMETYPADLPKVVFAGFIIEHPKMKKIKCRVTVQSTKQDFVFGVIKFWIHFKVSGLIYLYF